MNTIAIEDAMPHSRIKKLSEELKIAINNTDKSVISKWALSSANVFIGSLKRRGIGLLKAIGTIASGTIKETVNAASAAKNGQLKTHVAERATDLSTAIIVKKDQLIASVKNTSQRIKNDPLSAGPELLIAIIGFYFGSGGLDGDGGIPDLDLELGIGTHRSIWFHSILPGATIEAGIFSLATLVNAVHTNLPPQHDILWDRFLAENNRMSLAFAKGTCAGLAYHLMVDATWDAGKAYSDLPFSMPMAAHQGVMASNAIAEAIDVDKKRI